MIITNKYQISTHSIKKLNNRDHIVIPVVALKEGVLGDVYYSKSAIEQGMPTWNGVPVPVYHPKNNGLDITANSPNCEDKHNIGRLFHVNVHEGQLNGEIWIDIKKAEQLGYSNVINDLKNGKKMNVSTGLFAKKDIEDGYFKGKPYKYVIKDIKPDHLALLPDQKGKCSLDDGCGTFMTNKQTCGYNNCFCANCTLKKHLSESLKKEALELNEEIPQIKEIQSTAVIYQKKNILYRRGYEHKEQSVKFHDNPIPIKEDTHKIILEGMPVEQYIDKSETQEDKMNKDKEKKQAVSETVKKLVDLLITNSSSAFTENERDILCKTDESILNKMVGLMTNSEKNTTEILKGVNVLSDKDMMTFRYLQKEQDKKQHADRKEVLDNFESLTEEVVTNMSIDAIQQLKDSIKKKPYFEGKAGSKIETNHKKSFGYPGVIMALDKKEIS